MPLNLVMGRRKLMIQLIVILSLFVITILGLSFILIFLASFPSQFLKVLRLEKMALIPLYFLIPIIGISLVLFVNKSIRLILLILFKIDCQRIAGIQEVYEEEEEELKILRIRSRKLYYRTMGRVISSQSFTFLLVISGACSAANRGFYWLTRNDVVLGILFLLIAISFYIFPFVFIFKLVFEMILDLYPDIQEVP
jgi:hypothetical protein